MYEFFAQHYNELMQNASYEQRAKRVCTLLDDFGIKTGDILDLACGSGNFTKLLTQRGYQLIAVDNSPEMLAIAQQSCMQLEPAPLFLCQDMRRLNLYGTVDAAICMLDSLNHLPHLRALRQTFARLGLFVRPGGVLLFDVNTPYKHREILGNNCFIYETEHVFCAWQNSYMGHSSVSITLDFFTKGSNGYRRQREQFAQHAYPNAVITKALQAAGFQLEHIYDDLSEQAAGAQTQRALFVAKKL